MAAQENSQPSNLRAGLALDVPSVSAKSVLAANSASYTFSKDVSEVSVLFTATAKGKYVRDLRRDELELREDHNNAEILDFRGEENLPLRLAIVLDTSGSVDPYFVAEQKAAIEFIRQVLTRPDDQAMVITFSDKPHLRQDFTNNMQYLSSGIETLLDDKGGTSVFDALVYATSQMARHPEHDRVARVVVLISDGDDNSSNLQMDDALAIAQQSNVCIYTVESRFDAIPTGIRVLRELAEKTGGRALFTHDMRKVTATLAKIRDEIRSRYALAYRPVHDKPDGRFHEIHIVAKRDGKKLHVHARKGYYAR